MANFLKKVIVITGASEGIGRALALEFARQKPILVLAARNEPRLNDTASACERAGAIACAVPTDITVEEECQRLTQYAVERFGGIDILVNNAGMSMWTRFEEVSDLSIFEQLMKVNYIGSVYCTKYALPHLKKSKGRVVAISSVAGLTGVPTRTGYAASKHAMIGFFESLRIELAESGVTVTIIAPDYVQSKIHERSFGADGKAIGKNPSNQESFITAEACAVMIVKALGNRQRLLLTSWRGYFGRIIRTIAPHVIDRIAKQAVENEESKKG